MKQTFLLLAALLMVSVGTASAGDLDLDVKCPGSVQRGAALTVAVDIYGTKSNCSAVSVSRSMVSLVGNKGGTVGGAGLWGPFYKPIGPLSIPSCTGIPVPLSSITIINSVPVELAGTGAMAVVQVIDPKGRELGTGSCIVNIK